MTSGKELYQNYKKKLNRLLDKASEEYEFANFWGNLASIKKHREFDEETKEYVDKYVNKLRPMREELVNNLEKYTEQAMKSIEKTGARVFLAKTNEEAQKLFLQELEDEKVLFKSKSADAKEIGLLEVCKENGIEVVETDLGDVLVQLFDYKLPSYQLAPGVHFHPSRIVKKIKEKYNVDVEPNGPAIGAFFRRTHRPRILNARISLTSANAVAADDGSIVLVENEGNISLLTRLPPKHIVVCGISKIVPTVYDALLQVNMQERWNTLIGSYISFIRGPSSTNDVYGQKVIGMYGAQEVVVILVDDWRLKAIKENNFLKEFLHCISCKACNYVCTASRSVGNLYASKMGLGAYGIIKDYIHNGIESAVKNGLFLCTSCENCKNFCPVKVDLPKIMRELKKIAVEKGLTPPPLEEYVKKIKIDKNPFI
jgi:L-lactate utilization protein LutB